MRRSLFFCGLLTALAWSLTALLPASDSWPEFRGPRSDGTSDSVDLPLRWSETENLRWKTPIHGKAWSTPVVLGEQVWLTTATPDGRKMSAICVDRNSGRILLDRVLFENDKPRPLGNPVNCYGSPSPAIEDGRVYIGFGSYGTTCLDTRTFKTIWERRDLPCNHFRGPASSLVLFEDLLILQMDGSDHHYVAALDTKTGETRWKTDRSTDYGDLDSDGRPRANGDYRKAFNTPLIVRWRDQLQMISPGAKAAFSYDPRTGKELWTVRYKEHSTASRTVFADGMAYINTGYGKAQLFAVRTDGSGDVTESHVVWKHRKGVPQRSSPVVVNGLLFLCNDKGIASCLEPKTADVIWQDRLGGNYSASPISAEGRIYFSSEEGVTTVVEAGRKFKVLAKNQLDDGFMSSPAVAGKALYLRTKSHLYRIERAAGK